MRNMKANLKNPPLSDYDCLALRCYRVFYFRR
nr:MAG TPA: hypothetical protein [Caudoviricetes sp.]